MVSVQIRFHYWELKTQIHGYSVSECWEAQQTQVNFEF